MLHDAYVLCILVLNLLLFFLLLVKNLLSVKMIVISTRGDYCDS